jgi:serine/threonine protein kinase
MTNTLPNNYSLNARYTILQQIGQGGFGITYKALDTLFDRVVCIKELFISGNSRREESWSVSSQAVGHIDFAYFKNKFLDEAKKLANFDHPNIVKVLEYFEANNTAYMVMEFVEGKNLKDYVVERNRLNEQEALSLFTQLLDATKAIHSKNYLHRDIKPDNVLITPENKAVLIDFGTAKFHDEKSDNSHTSTLILLSHGYAPPEQYSNEHEKKKYTDIYALGATLYFMLTGQKPVQATDRTIKEVKAISYFNTQVSKTVEYAVSKAMELNPNNRFQDVEAFQKMLLKTKKSGERKLGYEDNKSSEFEWRLFILIAMFIIGLVFILITSLV